MPHRFKEGDRVVVRERMTRRQSQIMSAILQYQWNHDGRSPKLKEIGEAVGLRSLNSVVYQILRLQVAGYLNGSFREHRALRVLRMPGKVIRDYKIIWRTINGKLVYVGGSDDA